MNISLIRHQELFVSSYEDFLIWVEEKPDRHRKSAAEIMENLWHELDGEDPIYYLYDLYYNKKKSIREILNTDTISKIEFFSRATLHRLLFQKFQWIPRENTERTPVHEKQLSSKVSKEIAQFESKVAWLIWWREVARVFQMSQFEAKNYRIWKALYILKTLWWIDKRVLYDLSIRGGLSYAILAKSINKELEAVLERYPELNIDMEDIRLYPQSISRWFQYNADKITAGE